MDTRVQHIIAKNFII